MNTHYVAILNFSTQNDKKWAQLREKIESKACMSNFMKVEKQVEGVNTTSPFYSYIAEYTFDMGWILNNINKASKHTILEYFRRDTKSRYRPYIQRVYQWVNNQKIYIEEEPVIAEENEEVNGLDNGGVANWQIGLRDILRRRELHPQPKIPKVEKESIDVSVSEATSDEEACAICKGNKKTHICVPCGHVAFCGVCTKEFIEANQSSNCVVCRAKIDNIIKVWY